MARAEITVNSITTTASAPPAETNGDATNGHYVANNGSTWLIVRNADSGGPHVLSVGYTNVDGQAVDPKDYSIPASATRNIRLGDPRIHGTRTNIDAASSQLKIIAHKLA